MLCAILLGVIPILAKEPPQSRALKSWLDIWLPLLLALPIVAVPLLPGATHLPSPLLLSLVNLIPVSLAALIAGAALIDSRCRPVRCIDGNHVIALIAIAIVLLLAAFTGRLMDWSGHLLITAAMLWLWTVSSEPSTAAGQASTQGDPVFLVDWTGPLRHPIGALAQSLLLLAPLGLLLAVLSRYLMAVPEPAGMSVPMQAALLLPAVAQAAVLAALWIRVAPAAAIRCSVSTSILTVLFGLGVLCARLIPWLSLVAGLRHGVESSYEVTDLTGLSTLLLPALLLLALAALGVTQFCARRTLLTMGWGLVAVALVVLAISLSVARSHWPAAPRQATPSAAPPAPNGSGDLAPQSSTGTFLQDSAI